MDSRRSETYVEQKYVSDNGELYLQEPPREKSQQQEEHSSFTHTEVRVPLITPQAPLVMTTPNIAQELVGEGFTASAARISGSASNQEVLIQDSAELSEQARKDEERKQRELEKIEQKHVKETEKKAEQYRKDTEEKAEKIRKELEEQHEKDIKFRKEQVEQTVETQKKQLDVKAKYAKKELERDEELAKKQLEQSKMTTGVEVRFDSAAGTTASQGTVVSESTTSQVTEQKEEKTIGSKIRDFLLGRN